MKRFSHTIFLLICFLPLQAQFATEWVQSLGGQQDDATLSIAADSDANIYGVGYFRDSMESIQSYGLADVLLYKYNPSGNLIWSKKLGSVGEDAGNDLAIDKNGNVFICGYYRNGTFYVDTDSLTNAGAADAFVVKVDSAGLLQWLVAIQSPANELATAIACDNDGNVYVAGTFRDSVQVQQQTIYGIGGVNNFVIKLDAAGNLLWQDVLSTPANENIQAIECGPSEALFLTGFFRDTYIRSSDTMYAVGLNDIFLAKYAANGQFDYWKNYGGSDSEFAYALAVDSNAVYLAGMFVDSVYFDGQLLVSSGELDICLIRSTLDGAPDWIRNIGGFDDSKPFDIALSQDDLWLVGYYDGFAWSGQDSINSRNQRHAPADLLVAQFDKNGQPLLLKSYGGVQNDYATSVICQDTAIYVAGLAEDSLYIDSLLLIGQGGSDALLIKFSNHQTVSNQLFESSLYQVKLYPNPVVDVLQLEYKLEHPSNLHIVLADSRGAILDVLYSCLNCPLSAQLEYSTQGMASGLYYIVVQSDKYRYLKAFIKND